MIKIIDYRKMSKSEIIARKGSSDAVEKGVSEAVSGIISDVRERGDAAVLEYTRRFDGVELDSLEVGEQERLEGVQRVTGGFLEILNEAACNIKRYHSRQVARGYAVTEREGIVLGQRVTPLQRVGLYVPGGTASYPSTVLMNCIPASLAGVEEIVMVTPPGADGKISPDILAAAQIAGVDRIFKCGGAQAIAALAYGTESVPRVDKIVGPGNVFVAEAKRQVFGVVGIDMIAGPSEILVISDRNSDPAVIAADLLSQAEHDKNASAILITICKRFANLVAKEIERQLETLTRAEIARESIDSNGKIIIVKTIEQAIEISNELAPEHLELCVDEPFDYLSAVRNAGSVFLGRNCPEALGDYFAGTNHTLPTGGTARFSSPLSVDDFVKKSSYMYYSPSALERDAEKIAAFAEREGLSGHGRSALSRFRERDK
ncbi:MAG: histidinol dehydrogenase [Oscillospiraceae bacterium]|jgi:histidinol dehydrogenase|nr:histidinol dehydrogenase [Oscillospiraceae bacterium]